MLTFGLVLVAVAAIILVGILFRIAGGSPSGLERAVYSVLALTPLLASLGVIGFHYYQSWNSDQEMQTKNQDENVTSESELGILDITNECVRDNLTDIHCGTVGLFITAPGRGRERWAVVPKASFDVVTHPSPSQVTDAVEAGLVSQPTKPTRTKKSMDNHWPADHPREIFDPELKEQWSLRGVNLVGLVLHQEPVVYPNEKVPGMKEVKEMPTRALDQFEGEGLESLRRGENFAIRVEGDKIRMIAPIFAAAQCTSCHQRQGEMLGAFTYTIQRQKRENFPRQ